MTVMWEVGVGMLEGARKYGRHNFRVAGVRASVYVDAAKGHIDQWWEGEDIDEESGLSHITKSICSLIVLRDAMINDMMNDDRPPKANIDKVRREMQEAVDLIFERFPDAVEPYIEGAPRKVDLTPAQKINQGITEARSRSLVDVDGNFGHGYGMVPVVPVPSEDPDKKLKVKMRPDAEDINKPNPIFRDLHFVDELYNPFPDHQISEPFKGSISDVLVNGKPLEKEKHHLGECEHGYLSIATCPKCRRVPLEGACEHGFVGCRICEAREGNDIEGAPV
jgi:hypothetical protein